MELTAGTRLRSTVCDTEVIVVRPPDGDVDLGCGGQPMVAADAEVESGGAPAEGLADGSPMGKRYADEDSGLEVLVVAAGDGTLTLGGEPLPMKGAKPLPSSD